ALLKARDPKLPAVLRRFAQGDGQPIRAAAIRGLAAFDDAETPGGLLKVYKELSPAEKRDALATLATRVAPPPAPPDAVEKKAIPSTDLSSALIRDLRNLKDDALNARITEVWGQARETSADKAKLVEQYKAQIRRGYQDNPDPMLGRAVFAKTCG